MQGVCRQFRLYAVVQAEGRAYDARPRECCGGNNGGVPCDSNRNSSKRTAFEVTSKRRKGYPSETRVKRGSRILNGGKELLEKLGRNDPCPCGSGRRFQEVLHAHLEFRWFRSGPLLLEIESLC